MLVAAEAEDYQHLEQEVLVEEMGLLLVLEEMLHQILVLAAEAEEILELDELVEMVALAL